jgi:hypothetical protein
MSIEKVSFCNTCAEFLPEQAEVQVDPDGEAEVSGIEDD